MEREIKIVYRQFACSLAGGSLGNVLADCPPQLYVDPKLIHVPADAVHLYSFTLLGALVVSEEQPYQLI